MQLTRPDFFGENHFFKRSIRVADAKKIEKRKKFLFVFTSALLILLPIFLYAVITLSNK